MNEINTTVSELPWLWAGLGAYALATFIAMRSVFIRGAAAGAAINRSYENYVLLLLVSGVVLLAAALAERWLRIGHGPFVNLFELLMSQLFSLGVIFGFAYWRFPVIRPTAVVALPLMWILGIWILLLHPTDPPFPPTYSSNWLWAHVGFGKIFLGFCMLGTALAGTILLRWNPRLTSWFRHMPTDAVLDHFAWRFMLMAFIFHSLMLVAGAVWAQDAWGRFWSWDALETSAFLTWLALGGAIHARLTYRLPIRGGAIFICIVFVLAFLTYFGAPFYSEAAHKGVI